MGRMTASEWKKKKEEEIAQGTSRSPASTAASPYETTPGVDSQKRMTPSEWKQQKASTSFEWWMKSSIGLLNETQDKTKNWSYSEKHDTYSSKASSLLASADGWRKKYAGNDEALAYIDSIVDSLSNYKQIGRKYKDHYSKYESQEMYDIYQLSTDDLWKKVKSGEKVAYTTKDGQEITWKALYDSRSLKDQKAYYSSLDDWEKNSKGINSTLDMPSDAQTVWRLMNSNTPESWAEAQRAGWGKAQYDAVAKERDDGRAYISQKYGIDFNAYDAREQLGRLYNELDTKAGEMYTFDYMDDMDEDELAVLTYVFNTQGRDSAIAWHKSRVDTFEERHIQKMQQKWQEFGQEHAFWASVGSLGTNILAGAEWLVDAGVYLGTGRMDENRMAMRTNAARGGVMSTIDSDFGDFLYSTAMSGFDSALSMAAFGGTGGAISQGLGAAAQGTQDALDRGLSSDQAFMAGVVSGTAEAAFEKFSIGNFKALKEVPSYTLKGIAKNIAISMGVNASEEMLTEIANITYDTLAHGDLAHYTREDLKNGAFGSAVLQVLEAGASGALMGFGFGAVGSAGNFAGVASSQIADAKRMNALAKGTLEADGGVGSLLQLANEVAGVSSGKAKSKIEKLSGKVESKATAKNVGKLYSAISSSNNTQNKADIVKSLESNGVSSREASIIADSIIELNKRNGITSDNASVMADDIAEAAFGGDPSKKDKAVLETGKVQDAVRSVLNDIVMNEKSTMSQRNQKMDDAVTNVKAGVLSQREGMSLDVAKEVVKGNLSALKESLAESKYEVSAEGKTLDKQGNDVSIIGVESNKGGKLILKTENGTIDASEVSFATEDEAFVYSAIANMDVSAASAWALIKGFNKADGVSAQLYAIDIPLAYKYGKLNYKAGLQNLSITPSQSAVAFQMGRSDAEAAVKSAAQEGTEATISEKNADKEIIFDGFTYSNRKANKVQKASMAAIELINKMSNLEVHVYQSVKENGKFYAMVDGKKRIAPNGYFRDGNKIYIDINAGADGRGVMLFTMSHEIGHYIAENNAADFKAISDFLFAHYGPNAPIDLALKNKKALVKESYKRDGKPIPSEAQLEKEAHEELVCDMLSRMLADQYAYDKLMELKQENLNAFQKLGEAIKKFLDKIAKLIGVYDTQTADFQMAASIENFGEEAFRQLQDMYIKAFVKADANFQTAQEQFSTDTIRGTADGAVVQSEVTEATLKEQPRTEFEALPKQMMSLSTGAGTLLHHIEGLIPTKIKGISGKTINGYTGRDVRAYAMGISGFTKAQIQRVNEFMDAMSDFMEEAGVTYKFIGLQDVKDAQLHYTYNADGSIKSIVLSAMVKNGDYPVNFDLSSICKKRVAMSKLIDKLAKRGSLDNGTVKLTPANIFKINTALKNAGYETACLGCFVESKRYNSLEWAKKFCNKWNAAVKKVNPNATYFGYGDASFNEDSFTLEQAVKIDEAATKYITTTKTERLANALAKYKSKEEAGLPLVESFSKAARDRLVKSNTISDELKAKYISCDPATLNMADVEFLLENGILPGATLSNKQAVTEMVKSGEAYQHLLRPSDLLTDRGISKLEALPNFHGVLYGHYGSGTPKLMQSYTPYNSEIALLPAHKNSDQTLAEYLYTIAGVRMQSFSDFQIQNIYDYLQMVGDLAARKVPAHAYTKEISFAKLLGMTGIKCNLSVMFDIDPTADKAHAGLTKLNKLVHRGEYAKVVLEDEQGRWVYNIGDYQTQRLFAEAYPDEAKRFLQSIGFGDAVKLQTSPGYSANCGIIGVGYSDLGIFAMLDDNRIRYIIPYHASSLPAEIKLATNIALGTDYTPYQNNMKIKEIVDRNGNKVNWTIKEAYKRLGSGQAVINELNEKIRSEGWVVSTSKAQNGHGSYGLYENLQETNDPRQTASNFMDWCIGNSTLPLFYQFASHENYYKMLYDFNVYDCVTEEYAPQQAVTNTYPTMVDGQVQAGNVTDGNFDTEYLQGTIDKQMAFMDAYSRNLDEDLDAMADKMESGNYTLFSERVSNKELSEMDETALYIKNTDMANYIGMIFNGTKTEETRSRRTLDAFIGKDFYVTDGKYVYGSIVLGEPHKYTEAEFRKLENRKKHRVPTGDKYDIKPGGIKWAYPIVSYKKFDKPKKLSDSTEYKNSFQARQVLYSSQETDIDTDAVPGYDGSKRETKQEVIPYGQNGKAEDHASFIRRMHEGSRKIKQVRGIIFGYTPSRLLYASKTAEDTYRELKRLGIKCFLHKGLEYNFGGKTYSDLGETGVLSDGSVAIYDKAFGDGIEYAGHEAFHVWKKSADREAYVETLRRNISITSSVYGIEQADTVLREYFGGDVEALSSEKYKAQFQEELYALVSGKIHSGTNEAGLRTMFKDYTAVKVAWNDLLKKQSTQKGQQYSSNDANAQRAKTEARYSDRYTVERAKEYFGTTTNFAEAGFILPSGEMLKFTDDKHRGKRQFDHRAIGIVYGVDVDLNVNHGFNEESGKFLNEFVENGGIRFDAGDPDLNMDIGLQLSSIVPITKAQEQLIRDLVEWKKNREELYEANMTEESFLYDGPLAIRIDFGGNSNYATGAVSSKDLDAWGVKHLSYEGGQINAERIIADIRHYYNTGEARKPSVVSQFRFQDRVEDSVSNRSLLANAFESVAQNDIERNKIQEYKSKIALIDAEEKKLRELNEQIKELSFSKGTRDTKKIKGLKFDAAQAANRINTYDKQLLRLEASKPLQDILAREKKRAYKKAEQEGKKALAKQREKAAETQKALLEKWQDSRKKAVENREKTAMRHKIQRVVGELNDLLLSNDKKRHVPENLKKAVADALSLVNMDTVGAEERAAKYAALIAKETDPDKIAAYTVTMENILRQGEKMGQRLKELRDAYEEFSESDDPDIANAYDPVIAGSLKELASSIGNTSLRNMTIDQLQDVYDMYKMVLTRVRDANKSFTNARNEAIGSLASRVVGEVRKIRGERKYRLAMLDAVRSFSWNNLKPVYAMERIGSNTLAEAFNSVRAGEDTWAKDVGEARAYYLDKSKKHGYDSWDFDKKYTFKSTSGLEFELTLEQIMSLYAYSKREQALDHLRLGGFVFDSNIETYKERDGKSGKSILKYKVNTAEAHQISADILAEITGKLSSEQKTFVDDMQEYLSTVMGAKGNEVTMKMYGVKLFKEKFYFPLKSAKQFMFEQNEVAGEVRIKNSGFTNKVVARANNPVILNGFMDVWSDHVNDMSMYHSFVLPLEDFNRIFNYKSPKQEGQPPVSVKGTIQGAYSPAAVDYVKQLITDLNGGAMSDPRETLGKRLAAKFKKAKVFASMSVVIQQPSAIGRSWAVIDPKYFRPTKDGMNHDQLWNELKQYAPVAVIKEMGYFDTNMGRSTRDFIKAKEYSGFKDKVKGFFTDAEYRDEKLSRLPALADELTWCAIWNAVKRETVSTHKDLRPGSEEFLKAAGERFTEVVTKTQVYDSVLARSANMRSKSGLMSMITSFMAEPTTTINMLEDAILKGKRGDKKYARKAFASVAVSIILNNALVAIVYAMRDDDEDETFVEKYMQALVSGMLDDFNPITYYPYLKDIWSLFQGYDVERADMSLISDLADAAKGLVTAYTSEDGDVAGAWWGLTGTVANLFGIPMDNIRRDINGGINFVKTIIEDVNGRATTWGSMVDSLQATAQNSIPIWGWFPDEKKSDKLYDAIISGDTAYVNRMKGSYKDENAYNNAVRQALRENDPRIKEAAIAGYNGDPSERVRIAKLIIADGFDQDDVVAAINAEINKMEPNEASEPKKKGFYTAEDFAREIANGDQATANAAKTDIIRTAEKNGKTEDEAEDSFKSSAKSEMKKLYLSGDLSERKAVNALVSYCDMDETEAELLVESYGWEKQGYESATSAAVRDYNTYCATLAVPKDVYLHIRSFSNNTENDKDANGKSINYSAMKKVIAEIDAQRGLSSAQKTAIARSLGWSDKNINKYKTW